MTSPPTIYGQADTDTPDPVSGRAVSVEKIIPADVLARVELLRKELDLIRSEMGRAKDQRPEIAVSNVAPREVIFQASTLLRKANQLRFEVTAYRGPEPQINFPSDIQPLHVWVIVDAAYGRILTVKRKLGITGPIEEARADDSVTPANVFRAIIRASQEFDGVLRQPLSANDTFQQVVSATHYMQRLLAQFPGAIQMPALPAFERGKRPVDVYDLLAKCYTRVHAVAERSGLEALKLEVPKLDGGGDNPTNIEPSEVYDLATILVSELTYLHGQLKNTDPPTQAYDPAFKVPAHVYQRAGLLLLQLTELEKRVEANPDWLTR